MKLYFKSIAIIFGILLLISAVWLMWGVKNERPPEFFPMNEPKGEYLITKDERGIFLVTYTGPNSYSTETITGVIGRADYDLDEYTNQKIIITKGEFQNSFTQQCIQGQCKEIGGPQPGLVIKEIRRM